MMKTILNHLLKVCQICSLFCIAMLIFSSCSQEGEEETSSATVVQHPIQENIPHYDRDHIPVDTTRTFDDLPDPPAKLILLYDYLQNPNGFEPVRLEVLIDSPPYEGSEEVYFLNNRRLVFLDKQRNQLKEYYLDTDTTIIAAPAGQGPSDINFPREMIRRNEHLFIVRGDAYISSFNCESVPCEFVEAVSLDTRPISLTYKNESYAVLSRPDLSEMSERDIEMGFDNIQAVNIIDSSGQVSGGFGQIYKTNGHRLLLSEFTDGRIRFVPAQDMYALTYDRFPYVYIYDAESLGLIETYEIPKFILGKQSYDIERRALSTVNGDMSRIRNIQVINDELLLLEISTVMIEQEPQSPGERTVFTTIYEYYVIDPGQQEPYYIGELSTNGFSKTISVLDTGLAIHNYEDGYIDWIEM